MGGEEGCRKPQVAAASDSLTLKGNAKSQRSPSGSGGRQRRTASGTAARAATRAGWSVDSSTIAITDRAATTAETEE